MQLVRAGSFQLLRAGSLQMLRAGSFQLLRASSFEMFRAGSFQLLRACSFQMLRTCSFLLLRASSFEMFRAGRVQLLRAGSFVSADSILHQKHSPLTIVAQSKTTLWKRLEKNSLQMDSKLPLTPIDFNLNKRPQLLILSKAALKSSWTI